MVEVSKHLFERACGHLACEDLLHPWSSSCLTANIMSYVHSVKGSYEFYAYVYMIQIAMRGKMVTIEDLKKFGKQYVMSGVLGFLISGSSCTMACLLRNFVLGKFSYYSFIWIPNTLNGLAIYLEPPSRRGLVINLFCNLVIEYWINTLKKAGYINVTPARQTFFFMVGSAFLFYLMRLEGDRKRRTKLLWFFTPEKVNRRVTNNNNEGLKADNESICPHKGTCWKHVLKGTGKMFGAGCAISVARIILPKISSPIRALSSLRARHLKLGLFLGGYIGIYRAVICLLCRHYGKDDALYALPAGFLAGASFRWNPSLAYSIAAVTGAMKLLSTIMYEKKMITERIPLPELMYCLCQGLLFHARHMHPDTCPKYIFTLMKTITNGCNEQIYEKLLEAVKPK